jgi:NAD(P)-dependent dehydrogenase (short-subunit alcohol dehydrogenase family)
LALTTLLGYCVQEGSHTVGTGDHEDEPVRLDGQVALVTGAGRGIGRAIALGLSGAGASVAVCARSQDEGARTTAEIAERKGHALAVRADVSDRHDVEHTVAQVQAEMGLVDLLVNNAGRSGGHQARAASDPDDWWQTMEVNVRGPLYCSRAVLPGMLARGRGRIVNVSSHAGFAAWPMMSDYAVSKLALLRLTENLAAETKGQGVHVFAVVPGVVRTAMTEDALTCGEPSIEQFFQWAFDNGLDPPVGATAGLVAYLASGAADALSGRYVSTTKELAGLPGDHADVHQMIAAAEDIVEGDLYVVGQRD